MRGLSRVLDVPTATRTDVADCELYVHLYDSRQLATTGGTKFSINELLYWLARPRRERVEALAPGNPGGKRASDVRRAWFAY